MKNTLYALICFTVVVLIAVSYQLHLTNLTEDINIISNKAIQLIESEKFNDANDLLTDLEQLWEKNHKILMAFQDHSSVNEAAISLSLAVNCYRTKEYSQVSDNLINFTSILNELASENIPSVENIL